MEPGRPDDPGWADRVGDAGAILDGWHGDGARTFYVGTHRPRWPLHRQDPAAMMAGIAAAVPGNHIEDISLAVEAVAREGRLGLIRQFVGHGIGTEMHEEPQVPNFRTGRPGRGSSPASASRSSRCSRSAATTRGSPRRLDGRDEGRVAGRLISSTHRRHRGRSADPDGRLNDGRGCRERLTLICCAFVCRPFPVDVRVRKGSKSTCRESETRSKSKDGDRTAPQYDVRSRAGEWPPGSGSHQRQAADELHPVLPGDRVRVELVALRPHARSHHVSTPITSSEAITRMKIR